MNCIEKYFKDKAKDISFIELKEDSYIYIGEYAVRDDVPLPILTSNLIEEIQNGNLEDEIRIKNIIDGIIYIVGVDIEFPYIDEYKNILIAYNKDIGNYIFYNAIKNMQDKDYDNSAIKLRTLMTLQPDNAVGLFNYAIVLEEIAKKFMEDGKVEEGKEFLDHSIDKLELVLDMDKNFSPVYYKLGFHYRYSEKYLKANLIWEKFLQLSNDELLLQEVREEMNKIEDDVVIETALTYLAYDDFDKSLDYLLKLMPKYKDDWNINYLIGSVYSKLGEYILAIDYLNKAMELNDKEPDIYNELGIIHFNNGDVNKAIKIFSLGIDNCSEDYKLYFNRGLSYIQLKEYESGMKDVDRASLLNPEDENIRLQKESLKSMYC